MRERIDQEVSVVMYFSARKKEARPHLVSWQNREYTIREMGYHHSVPEGKTLHHIYEFTVNEADLWMRLNLNTDNMHWVLEEVNDGLAT